MTQTTLLPEMDVQPRVRRSTYIADQLKGWMTSGQLKPGTRLPTEEQLCKHFQVSRTTLREAIQMLRVSGLLKVTPGRGSYVQLPNLENALADFALFSRYGGVNAEEVNQLRLLLERSLIEAACKAPTEKKKEIYNHVLNRHASSQEAEEAERQWHLSLAQACDNTLAYHMLSALLMMQQHERQLKFEDQDEILRTIQLQIRFNGAITDGDNDLAQRVMAGYLGDIESLRRAA